MGDSDRDPEGTRQATVQAWVAQLCGESATHARLCDETPAVKSRVWLAAPRLYFARVRAEREGGEPS